MIAALEMSGAQAYEQEEILRNIIPNPDECYTHDYPELAKWDSHYLFVYGSLKKDFKRSSFLDDAPIVGVGYTKTPMFEMYLYDRVIADVTNRFPVCLFKVKGERTAHMYGEVYQVTPELLRTLDYVESNGVYFKRVKMPFEIQTFRDNKVHQTYAWCYLGMRSFWDAKVETMAPCDLLKSNQKDSFVYYNYMKKYENEVYNNNNE